MDGFGIAILWFSDWPAFRRHGRLANPYTTKVRTFITLSQGAFFIGFRYMIFLGAAFFWKAKVQGGPPDPVLSGGTWGPYK